MFAYLILICAVVGVAINITAIILIQRKRDRSVFHDLLVILNASDVGVVTCCALLFSLPDIWDFYKESIHPHIGQYLLPCMHIAVMMSVYSTILISFERYIRICFYCQLKETSILTDENIKFYKMFVIVFPILFYIPKFFEVKSHYEITDVKKEINCHKYRFLGRMLNDSRVRDHIIGNMTEEDVFNIENLASKCNILINEELAQQTLETTTQVMPKFSIKNTTMLTQSKANADRIFEKPIKEQVSSLNEIDKAFPTLNSTNSIMIYNTTTAATIQTEAQNGTTRYERDRTASLLHRENMLRNVTISTKTTLKVEVTDLRKNMYYYKIYFVYLNTFFASILPLALLIFFNISTAVELIKMSKLETRAAGAFPAGRSSIMIHTDHTDYTTQSTRINLADESLTRRASMAITRRTSAAYSSFIAATSLHNNTLQDGQNSRGSLGWYENDENIINRSNQNPFCDYSRNGRRSTEISELPKIFVEDDHQDTIISLTSETKYDSVKPLDINDSEIEEIICSGANLLEASSTLLKNSDGEEMVQSFMLYENPLSEEFSDTINKPTSKVPLDLFDHQYKLSRRWSVSNLCYECDVKRCREAWSQNEHLFNHRRLAFNCNRKILECVDTKEDASKYLKRLSSLPDYHNSLANTESLRMLSNNILIEKRKARLEDVPLLLSKDENMDTENKTYMTNIDCGKEAILPHSRTIQEIIENSADSGELPCSQKKSLPDIVPHSANHQKMSILVRESIDKTCLDCDRDIDGSPLECEMHAVKELLSNKNVPRETKHITNPNVSRRLDSSSGLQDKEIELFENEINSNNCDQLFIKDVTKNDMFPDYNINNEEGVGHSKQNGILSRHRATFKPQNDSQSSMQPDSESKCQRQNKSISVDRLQVSSQADEVTLLTRESNTISNGKCEHSSLSTPTNVRNYKAINQEIKKKNLVVCHADQCGKEKDTLFSKSRYRSSVNSTDSGQLNRNRKRSFMNLPQRVHVPKAIQISSETKKETKLARISLCIVWLFIFCHVWKLIPTAYETFFTEDMGVGLNIEWPYWLTIVKEISHSLITINSGLNFLIYIVL